MERDQLKKIKHMNKCDATAPSERAHIERKNTWNTIRATVSPVRAPVDESFYFCYRLQAIQMNPVLTLPLIDTLINVTNASARLNRQIFELKEFSKPKK